MENSSKPVNGQPTADASTTDGSCSSSSGNTDLTSVMEVARCGDPKRDKVILPGGPWSSAPSTAMLA